jgi:hypothetical protein
MILVSAGLVLTLAPGAKASPTEVDRGTVFRIGGNVNIAEGDTAEAVIAIGGDVSVAGTVRTTIVAVGGDVRLASTAVVGSDAQRTDTSVVLVGGSLDQDPGATVTGETNRVSGSWSGDVWGRGVVDPVVRPFGALSLISWIGGTLLALLGAVLIVTLAPRQTTAIRDRVASGFWSSLGWGALGLIIVVPLVTVLLIISIIGLLALLPWFFVVVATLVFGAVAVALLLGDWVLPRLRHRGTSMILAVVVGVLILRLLQLIPVVGSIVGAVAWIVGFGGAVVALWSWQRLRREHRRDTRVDQGPASPEGSPPGAVRGD